MNCQIFNSQTWNWGAFNIVAARLNYVENPIERKASLAAT